MSLYYLDDFSLGEIADEYEVSRQAVYDNIKRTEAMLEQYEEKSCSCLRNLKSVKNFSKKKMRELVADSAQTEEAEALIESLEKLD
ncbi:UPF0122 protein YlxM [Bacillus safensis]|uniref:UPF0122 protein YlxM n=1 Tax=Bacillus safensis TaxID=561879 RepID=A0A5S9M714_BACIA|nr:UPF0122 protein YlxM [Bacillus safensis]